MEVAPASLLKQRAPGYSQGVRRAHRLAGEEPSDEMSERTSATPAKLELANQLFQEFTPRASGT